MKWLWPLSWYFRMRELEAMVVVLQAKNRELDALFRAQAIAQSSMNAAYVASCVSLASMGLHR